MEKETIEETAEKMFPNSPFYQHGFIEGSKWQAEQDKKMFSEEDIIDAIEYGANLGLSDNIGNSFEWTEKKDEWFEQFKKK